MLIVKIGDLRLKGMGIGKQLEIETTGPEFYSE